MALLGKLFQAISRVLPNPGFSEKEAEMLSNLNPEKFYAENVRHILGVSHASAVRICETAVRQGLFERRVEVICPDGAVAASADTEDHLPALVRCWHQEGGFLEPNDIRTDTLEKAVFYRLNEQSDSVPFGQTA
jgi:hypothetical protein